MVENYIVKEQVRYWNQLVVFHSKLKGVQRLRCYPFKEVKKKASRKRNRNGVQIDGSEKEEVIMKGQDFHGKHQQDTVALIPAKFEKGDFQYPAHSPSIEVGRLQLIFTVTLKKHNSVQAQGDVFKVFFHA